MQEYSGEDGVGEPANEDKLIANERRAAEDYVRVHNILATNKESYRAALMFSFCHLISFNVAVGNKGYAKILTNSLLKAITVYDELDNIPLEINNELLNKYQGSANSGESSEKTPIIEGDRSIHSEQTAQKDSIPTETGS